MWDYTDKVKDHFKNPRNAGSIENADGIGQVGSLACGDALKLYIKVDKETGRITDAKFQTFGCASAIASSSALTELVKGKTIEEARKVTNKEIAQYLGGLPEEKMHCSVMGMEAFEAAVESYKQGGKMVSKETEEGKMVCSCFGITEEKIIKAILANNLKTVEDVTRFTKAGGACGKCKPEIQAIIDKLLKQHAQPEKEQLSFAQMPLMQKLTMVNKVLNEEVLPQLALEGGSLEIIDIDGAVIKVKLLGACHGCPSAGLTLKNFIEQKLREKIDPSITIENAEKAV